MVAKQQVLEKKVERETKAKSVADLNERQKLLEKIEEKQQRSEENRKAILNGKVEQCWQESSKVKQTKEIAEEQIRNHEKATEEKLQAKLNTYKENRQRRLSERKVVKKSTNRASLQEITNDSTTDEQVHSPTIGDSLKSENGENHVDGEKLKELAENFRNRNLECLGLRLYMGKLLS